MFGLRIFCYLRCSLFHIHYPTVKLRSQSYASEATQAADNPPKNNTEVKNVVEKPMIPSNSRFVYPEFLPDPNPKYRHPIAEKLQRQDMIARR